MNRATFDAMLAQYSVKEMTGEGSVSWENGVRCVIPKVEIGGKAKQDTYTGKNLWDVPTWYREYSLNNSLKLIGDKTIFLPKGTYTVSFYYRNVTSEESNSFARTYSGPISAVDTTKQLQYWPLGLTADNKEFLLVVRTITLTADSWLGFDDGQLRGGFEYQNIQIEAGSAATDYEPYTGGIPAPNPNCPIKPVFSEGTTVESNAGGIATAPKLLAVPGTKYMDTWDAQTGKGVRRCAVIESYAGEAINTPYISSTGELTAGAFVVYGIDDKPFQTNPQPFIQPHGAGQLIQTGGTLGNCPITAAIVAHS